MSRRTGRMTRWCCSVGSALSRTNGCRWSGRESWATGRRLCWITPRWRIRISPWRARRRATVWRWGIRRSAGIRWKRASTSADSTPPACWPRLVVRPRRMTGPSSRLWFMRVSDCLIAWLPKVACLFDQSIDWLIGSLVTGSRWRDRMIDYLCCLFLWSNVTLTFNRLIDWLYCFLFLLINVQYLMIDWLIVLPVYWMSAVASDWLIDQLCYVAVFLDNLNWPSIVELYYVARFFG